MAEAALEQTGLKMKAIVRREYGTPDVLRLQEIAKPVPEDDQVLVKVLASSVNPSTWHRLTGTPFLARMGGGFRKPKRQGLGADLAGRVAAVGSAVAEFKIGDEVFGEASGSYAEYAVASTDSLVHKPSAISFEEAGTVAVAAITALQGLRDKGGIKAGDRVLINGASGGVGSFAVQIAKARGAHVTAVCRTRNVEMVRSIGADRVIDYTVEDFVAAGERYDLVLDNVGNRSVRELRRVLAPDGVYVAVSGPKKMAILLGRMLLMAAMSLVGKRKMRPMLAITNKGDLMELRQLLESGEIKPVIDRRYTLGEVPDALRYQGEGHGQGKTVIVVASEPEKL